MTRRQRLGWEMQPQVQACLQPPELEDARRESSLERPRELGPA